MYTLSAAQSHVLQHDRMRWLLKQTSTRLCCRQIAAISAEIGIIADTLNLGHKHYNFIFAVQAPQGRLQHIKEGSSSACIPDGRCCSGGSGRCPATFISWRQRRHWDRQRRWHW
jgi:hypothetical protein